MIKIKVGDRVRYKKDPSLTGQVIGQNHETHILKIRWESTNQTGSAFESDVEKVK